MLYTKMAIGHLTLIDATLKKFSNCANLNMNDPRLALWNEREKLLRTKMAYMEAQDILNEIRYRKRKKIYISSFNYKNEEDERKEREQDGR